MRLTFAGFLILIYLNLNGQSVIPFKENGAWGIKNKTTNEIVLSPKFKMIYQENDSMFILKNDSNQFCIANKKGNLLVNFSDAATFVGNSDIISKGKIMEIPVKLNGKINWYLYEVNRKRECVPNDYYPCPAGKDIDYTNKEDYLKHIQYAVYFMDKGVFDSAVYETKKAIVLNPNNPYPYYFGASLFLDNKQNNISYSDFGNYVKFKDWISNCLISADSLESRRYFKLKIGTIRYNYYKTIAKDSPKALEIDKSIRKFNPLIQKDGYFAVLGLAYTQKVFFEFGYAKGFIDYGKFLSFKSSFSLFNGITYNKGLQNNVDYIKFSLFSIAAPIGFGFSPILFTDYKELCIGLRPEIGLSYRGFSLVYGYNIIKGDYFRNYESSTFVFRYYVPMKTKNIYQ